MSSGARSSGHVYRPAAVSPLERRDVPSAVTLPSDFQNFRATITGEVLPTQDETHTVYFKNGRGKTSDGRPVRLAGFVMISGTGVVGDPPTEQGVAELDMRRRTYGLSLQGTSTEPPVSSGLLDLSFNAIYLHRATTPHGKLVAEIVGQGTIQFHRMTGTGTGQTFTATLIISSSTPKQILS